MKIYITIFFSLVFNHICGQQIVSIEDRPIGHASNTYYKDVNNVLNYFEGTWLYTSGNTQLKLVIEKKTQVYDSPTNTYIDYLVGEYKYSVDGNEIVNTLDRLNNPDIGLFEHGIFGNQILYKNLQLYSEYDPSILLLIYFIDLERPYVDSRCTIQISNGNPNQIKLKLMDENNYVPYPGAPMELRVPLGEYTLTKQ